MGLWQLIQTPCISKRKCERRCVPEIESDPWIPASQGILEIQWIHPERNEVMRQNVQTGRKSIELVFFCFPMYGKSFFFDGDGEYLSPELINL